MKNYGKILNFALPIFSVVAIICIWAIAAAVTNDEFVLPSVGETLVAALRLLGRGEFYRSLLSTVLRTLVAFSVSFAAAFLTALLSYKSKLAAKSLLPIIVVARVLPTIAVALLLVLWTSSRVAAVVVTALVIFPTLHESLFAALSGIDGELIEMAKVFGVDRKKTVRKIILPSVAPEFVAAVGAGITLSLKLMVAAEVIAHTPRSIGYMLNSSKIYFEVSQMMALVLVTVALGLAAGLLFKRLSEAVKKP